MVKINQIPSAVPFSAAPKTSIKALLNITGKVRERYTLIFQIIRRRRTVIFTPYRLSLAEFDPAKGMARALSHRKADVENARAVNRLIQEQMKELRCLVDRMQKTGKPFTARDIATLSTVNNTTVATYIASAPGIGVITQHIVNLVGYKFCAF